MAGAQSCCSARATERASMCLRTGSMKLRVQRQDGAAADGKNERGEGEEGAERQWILRCSFAGGEHEAATDEDSKDAAENKREQRTLESEEGADHGNHFHVPQAEHFLATK